MSTQLQLAARTGLQPVRVAGEEHGLEARGTPVPLELRAQAVLRILEARRGAAQAIRGETILERIGMPVTDNSRRWLKGVVEDLVLLHGIRVGASRGGGGRPPGYFLIVTAADLDIAIHPLWGEVYALLRRLRALTSKHDVARLFGQTMLRLDLDNDAAAATPAARREPQP